MLSCFRHRHTVKQGYWPRLLSCSSLEASRVPRWTWTWCGCQKFRKFVVFLFSVWFLGVVKWWISLELLDGRLPWKTNRLTPEKVVCFRDFLALWETEFQHTNCHRNFESVMLFAFHTGLDMEFAEIRDQNTSRMMSCGSTLRCFDVLNLNTRNTYIVRTSQIYTADKS